MASKKSTKKGRPSKLELCPELAKFLTDSIAAGASIEAAVTAAGISRTAFLRWVNEGEKPTAPKHYRDFHASIKRARRDCLLSAVQTIKQAAQRQWQAQAWLLERGDPHNWGPPALQLQAAELLEEVRKLTVEIKARGLPNPFQDEDSE